MRVSQRVSELQIQTIGLTLGWSQFTKGHNSVTAVDGLTELNLYTKSADALYLYRVSRKYHKGFHIYCADVIYIYESISKGFRVVDSNSRIDTRVVTINKEA